MAGTPNVDSGAGTTGGSGSAGGDTIPTAPAYDDVQKTRRRRASRAGPDIVSFNVYIKVVAPIPGGSYQTRHIDDVDIIRPATVRGHLRFWWRALQGHRYSTPEKLYEAESRLWGKAADDKGGRSQVEIRVQVERDSLGKVDDSDVKPYGEDKTPGSYALWPARKQRADHRNNKPEVPPAPRRMPGTLFRLEVLCPEEMVLKKEVRNTLRAWILFGGYGSRTRRGLGSLTVVEETETWLPGAATREAIEELFADDIFANDGNSSRNDTPLLRGAALHVGNPQDKAEHAWTTALGWLEEFRQGTEGGNGGRAREPVANHRPSISNWPEADKIRHLSEKTTAHCPHHNDEPAWPKAGFGLPIVGQFQKKARDGGRLDEPGPFELRWRSGNEQHDRLASPLIVKALPLANGKFVPCALWLSRAYPVGGEVGLARPRSSDPSKKEVDPDSAAPFDRLLGQGDTARFSALSGKSSLQEAFLDWLAVRKKTTKVAP